MHAQRLQSTTGSSVAGPLLLTPRVFGDERGFFFESWNQRAFAEALEADGQPVPDFVQDNHSRSSAGVLRGLHFQHRQPQGKLVQVLKGHIFDVAVDLRPQSTAFGQVVAMTLQPGQSVWLPPGLAHGFYTLSDEAVVAYKCSAYFAADDQYSVHYADPTLAIAWPWLSGDYPAPILSEKDAQAPSWLSIQSMLLGTC